MESIAHSLLPKSVSECVYPDREIEVLAVKVNHIYKLFGKEGQHAR